MVLQRGMRGEQWGRGGLGDATTVDQQGGERKNVGKERKNKQERKPNQGSRKEERVDLLHRNALVRTKTACSMFRVHEHPRKRRSTNTLQGTKRP